MLPSRRSDGNISHLFKFFAIVLQFHKSQSGSDATASLVYLVRFSTCPSAVYVKCTPSSHVKNHRKLSDLTATLLLNKLLILWITFLFLRFVNLTIFLIFTKRSSSFCVIYCSYGAESWFSPLCTNKTNHMNFTKAATATLAATIFLTSCAKDEYRRDEGMVWHTSYHITYRSACDMTDSIVAVFREVGGSLNVFDPQSLASRVNTSDSIDIDDNYTRVYDMSRKINRITDGAFDPTLGPFITAWGFGKGHSPTQDTLRIDSLLNITGLDKTRLSGRMLVKGDRRIEFNYSAIAKGFGCDKVGEMLSRNGVTDYLVEIGGEIYCSGKSPSGGKWRISVDRPVMSDSVIHESQCIVELTGKGLATSGNYRNFRRDAAGTYGHTISALTGRPARTDVLSASVIAPTAMEADALATAMMAMGSEKAEQLASAHGMAVMLVLSDSTVWTSDAFNGAIVSVP